MRSKLLLLPFFFFSFLSHSDAISCLVLRPGYGVLPEECPSSAIGCRIKVDEGNLVWHQIARLYDRNHMVCVLPLEYQSEEGCVEKPYGFRCWCSSSTCNSEENTWRIVELYKKRDVQTVPTKQPPSTFTESLPTSTTFIVNATTHTSSLPPLSSTLSLPSLFEAHRPVPVTILSSSSPTSRTTFTATSSQIFSPTTPRLLPRTTVRPTRRIGVTPPESTLDWRETLIIKKKIESRKMAMEEEELEEEEEEYEELQEREARDSSLWQANTGEFLLLSPQTALFPVSLICIQMLIR